jgi:hypothetical protein
MIVDLMLRTSARVILIKPSILDFTSTLILFVDGHTDRFNISFTETKGEPSKLSLQHRVASPVGVTNVVE